MSKELTRDRIAFEFMREFVIAAIKEPIPIDQEMVIVGRQMAAMAIKWADEFLDELRKIDKPEAPPNNDSTYCLCVPDKIGDGNCDVCGKELLPF